MKLYIESVFDKETNKLEDVRKNAIDAANKLEALHNKNAIGKIYYFSLVLDKLFIAIGDVGKEILVIDKNIVLEKPIPEIQLGDIPTKMAKYQELLIPQIKLDERKVLFTKIKDENGEDEINSTIKVTELPNNNPIYDWKGHKVELIDEQPKLLKIEAGEILKTNISFLLGAFGSPDNGVDYFDIYINGKLLRITATNSSAKVTQNNTEYYADVKRVEYYKDSLPGQEYKYGGVFKVTLRSYAPLYTQISILGKLNEKFSNEEYGYIQNSLEVEKIEKFSIPYPYTDIATKVDGIINHSISVKKDIKKDQGITFGCVMGLSSLGKWHDLLQLHNTGDSKKYLAFHRVETKKAFEIAIGDKYKIPLKKITTDDIHLNKPFFVQMSVNFKSGYITVKIDDKIETVKIDKSRVADYNAFTFGDGRYNNNINMISDMWYWIGDNIDLDKASNTDS